MFGSRIKNSLSLILISGLFLLLFSCSKKDDVDSASSNLKESTSASQKKSASLNFEDYIKSLESPIIKMLPESTYGFLLFLNTDNIANEQKKYWEKDLSEEVKGQIDSSLLGFETVLKDAGLLDGKNLSDIYSMESAQFVSRAQIVRDANNSNFSNHEDNSGFITKLELDSLNEKVDNIAKAVTKNGTPAKVIKKGDCSIIEFEDKGAIVPSFRFLGLLNSYLISASSVDVINEICSADNQSIPSIFTDSALVELGSKLKSLNKSVILAGLKGSPSNAIPFAFGLSDSNKADAISESDLPEEVLLVFNQSFDKSYGAELRVKVSENIVDMLSLNTLSSSNIKISDRNKLPSNTLLSLDLSNSFTQALIQKHGQKIISYEPSIFSILPDIKSISFALSSIDAPRLLPIPALTLIFNVNDTESFVSALKDLVKNLLQSNSMIPPSADWLTASDKSHSILTALGEEISISSKDTFVSIGTTKEISKLFLEKSLPETTPSISLNDIFSNSSERSFELVRLFINFTTLSDTASKVLSMNTAFGGSEPSHSDMMSPTTLINLLSSVGIAGADMHLIGKDELVVSVNTDRNPS